MSTSIEPSPDLAEMLERALRVRYPAAIVDLTRFPSNALMVDVRMGGRFFVMVFNPRDGGSFGVDEVGDDEVGLSNHYRLAGTTIDSAIATLAGLVSSEAAAPSRAA